MTVNKTMIWVFMAIIIAPASMAAMQWNDTFSGNPRDSGTPANDIGDGWTEVGGDHTYITDEYIFTDGTNRAIAQKILANYTWICWEFNNTANDYNTATMYFQYSGDRTLYFLWNGDTGFQYYDGGGYQNCQNPLYVPDNAWMCWQTVSPYSIQYGNDSTDMRELCQVSTTYDDGKTDYELGYNGGANGAYFVFNTTCAADDWSDCTDDIPGGSANYVAPTPPDNAVNNTMATINWTCPIAYTEGYLWFDTTYNLPTTTVVESSTENQHNYTIQVETQQTYYYIAGCYNTTTGNWATNETVRNWTYDFTTPSYSINFTNGSVYTESSGDIQFQVNFSDNFLLYSYNITVDGTQLYGEEVIEADQKVVNVTITPGSYAGLVNVTIRSADAHTSEEISEYKVTDGLFNDYLRYEFPEKEGDAEYVKISAVGGSIFDTFTTEKLTDRYVFEYDPLFSKETYEFEVESDKKIEIIRPPGGEYGGEYIIMGDHWMDFVSPDAPDAQVSIRRDSDTKVTVTVTNVSTELKEIQFNSVGELNIITVYYNFFVVGATETYPAEKLETQEVQYTLNVTGNSTYISSVAASFYYNYTEYAASTAVGTDFYYFTTDISGGTIPAAVTVDNVTFYWNYSITNPSGITTNYTTNETNQSIYKMLLDNCTSYYNRTQNYTFFNSSGLPVSVDMQALYTIWNGSPTKTRTYGFTGNMQQYQEICLWPDWAEVYGSYTLLFQNATYENKNIAGASVMMDNVTDTIQSEMVMLAESTSITITVVDEFNDPISNYVVETYLYNLVDNNHTLVDSQQTNGVGQVVVGLDVDGKEYRFYVRNQDGDLVYTEPTSTLTETSYTFQIVLGDSQDSIILALQQLFFNLTIDKTLHNFSVNWDDDTALIDTAELRIVKSNLTDTETMSSQTSILDTFTLSYNITNTTGLFLGQFWVQATADSNWYMLDQVDDDIREAHDIFGLEAALASMFFVGTILFCGLALHPIIAIVWTVIASIGFMAMGMWQVSLTGLSALIVTLIIVAVLVKRR